MILAMVFWLIWYNAPMRNEQLKYLPCGISNFTEICEKEALYVDKTGLIYQLIKSYKYAFISRPRRFGKSLLISTLECLFQGKKELFKGLDICKTDYSFERYPVFRLDLSDLPAIRDAKILADCLLDKVLYFAEQVNYKGEIRNYSDLSKVFEFVYKTENKRIVVLVDEYDRPILENITSNELESIQHELKAFFSVFKAQDQYIHFMFVTGITKFSQTSMFSGANQLASLERDDEYSALFGYSEEELKGYFQPYVKTLSLEQGYVEDKLWDKIKDYYNGYNFSDDGESVYNPYSVLYLFQKKKFGNYWFESGTPTYLLELLNSKNLDLSDSTEFVSGKEVFHIYKPEKMQVQTLMLHAGYLTISSKDKFGDYVLSFPNFEVKSSFYDSLIVNLTDGEQRINPILQQTVESFKDRDFSKFKDTWNQFVQKIPYDIRAKKNEAYYQTLAHCLFVLSNIRAQAECSTYKGRSDHIVEVDDAFFVLEYKYKKSPEEALAQIHEKKYHLSISEQGKSTYAVGIGFAESGLIEEDILVEELSVPKSPA
jgi:hypothetical protein